MPDLTGPLLSLDASGTIAKTLTYAKWRGIKYARQRVVPANPRSVDQTKVRAAFTYMSDMYKFGTTALSQSYELGSKGRPLTARNLFVKTNEPSAYLGAVATGILASPGNGGAPAPLVITPTPHATSIDVSINPGDIPPGWSVVAGWAIAWHPTNPTTTLFVPPIYEDTGANPGALSITGLPGTTLFAVSGYIEWLTAQGKTAYSIAINTASTTL